MTRIIRIAHSPDSDDAFMFYALAAGKLDTGDIRYVHELADIETLNRRALSGELEVSAVSIHAYAYLALKLYQPEIEPVVLPFDRIGAAIAGGEVEVGLLIHEGQLTFADEGFQLWQDLGAWWKEETGLPLPLGGNVVRRDLGTELIARIAHDLRTSIEYGLAHRAPALVHASRYSRGLSGAATDEFVGMYVNQWTVDYGPRGRRAVQLLLDQGSEAGVIPHAVKVEFVS